MRFVVECLEEWTETLEHKASKNRVNVVIRQCQRRVSAVVIPLVNFIEELSCDWHRSFRRWFADFFQGFLKRRIVAKNVKPGSRKILRKIKSGMVWFRSQ